MPIGLAYLSLFISAIHDDQLTLLLVLFLAPLRSLSVPSPYQRHVKFKNQKEKRQLLSFLSIWREKKQHVRTASMRHRVNKAYSI